MTDILIALNKPYNTLRNLINISIERDQQANIRCWVGNNCVVIKIRIDGSPFTMRCYLRNKNSNLREIYGDAYYPDELEVRDGCYADVVVCSWVEGEALSSVVERAIVQNDNATMRRLARSFDSLAIEMLSRQDWAHGDLSGDNIIVGEDGSMSLIDLDASYNERLAGSKSVELGTPAFQSPLRTVRDFDANIDDFTIALISTALHALSHDISLAARHPFLDGILLDGQRVADDDYTPLNEIIELFAAKGDFTSYRVAKLLRLNSIHLEQLNELLTFSRRGVATEDRPLELFVKMGIWGYFDHTTEDIVIPPLFDEAFEFRGDEGLVRVMKWWFYIDKSAEVIRSCEAHPNGRPATKRNL